MRPAGGTDENIIALSLIAIKTVNPGLTHESGGLRNVHVYD